MITLRLAAKSLRNRRFTTGLTIASIALSIALFIGVERIRQGARESFSNTISQTDLIVGAKGGSIQLLLYSVFRMGSATQNVGYDVYQKWTKHPAVQWTIPYSLGDSHRGFRVVGTDKNFYEHYRFRRDKSVEFTEGRAPTGLFDVALGGDVVKRLGYKLNQKIVIAHGVSREGEAILMHDDKPFTVVGILKSTATPIDRSVYVTLEGMEAMHIDWKDGGAPVPGKEVKPEDIDPSKIKVDQITAFLLRTKSRIETLQLQRDINDETAEPLMAIIPGVALSELWDGISYAEDGLRIVSLFVIIVGLMGMLVSLYNSLNERRREMAILRAVGSGPWLIARLLVLESMIITFLSILVGLGLIYSLLFIFRPIVETHFGLYLPINWLSTSEYVYLGVIMAMSAVLGFIPAYRAYRHTLVDGLSIRT